MQISSQPEEQMKSREHDLDIEDEGKPPFFSSWRQLYLVVLGNLVFLIVIFYLFMKAFE